MGNVAVPKRKSLCKGKETFSLIQAACGVLLALLVSTFFVWVGASERGIPPVSAYGLAVDGGVIRELTRYPEIEQIDLVEIDQLVVEVCKKYLPQTACRFDDPRVHIYYEDGLKFIRRFENEYDLIIVDSTDPFGPGEGLFTREFYGSCYKALKEDGIMVNQHESPFYDEDATACQRAHKRIVESFPISRVFQAHIPTYPSGHWLFGFASKKYHPLKDLAEARWNLRGLGCKYYTTTLHKGAFYLPAYVEELLKDVE